MIVLLPFLFAFTDPLSHLFQQSSRHRKGLTNQLVVCHDNRDTRVRHLIIRLGHHRELLHILHNREHVVLHCVEGVCKPLCMHLLFGRLIIHFTCHVELLRSSLIILLQNIVEKDVPNLWRVVNEMKMMRFCECVGGTTTVREVAAHLLLTLGAISPLSV